MLYPRSPQSLNPLRGVAGIVNQGDTIYLCVYRSSNIVVSVLGSEIINGNGKSSKKTPKNEQKAECFGSARDVGIEA